MIPMYISEAYRNHIGSISEAYRNHLGEYRNHLRSFFYPSFTQGAGGNCSGLAQARMLLFFRHQKKQLKNIENIFLYINNYSYLCKLHKFENRMLKKLVILVLLVTPLLVEAQSIRLTKYGAPSALYFDADRFFNFNLYERSRFELGLTWVFPNESAEVQRHYLGQWRLQGYGAYSTFDRDFKFGGSVQLRLPGRGDVKLRLEGFKDLEQAASRRLSPYQMLSTDYNTGYVASRYMGVKGAAFSLTYNPIRSLGLTFKLRQTWEDCRFYNWGLLYPTLDPSEQAPVNMFTELNVRADWRKSLILDIRGGRIFDNDPRCYLRSLLQYDAPVGSYGFNIFGQVGFCTTGTPYSRMFDVSGTGSTLYFFKNTFLTVRPNTFTTNLFAHLCLNYTAPLPLWDLSWSKPKPFLQINALWGMLFDSYSDGYRIWDGLELQAPYMGVFEPATGFDGLVRWGLLDLGFGVAYQICPFSAPYFNEDPSKNINVTIVATLIIDKYDK